MDARVTYCYQSNRITNRLNTKLHKSNIFHTLSRTGFQATGPKACNKILWICLKMNDFYFALSDANAKKKKEKEILTFFKKCQRIYSSGSDNELCYWRKPV